MPPECPVIGIPADIIMIPRDQYHLRMRQCGKQVIRFFKFSQKRLPVKQISRNQKKICLLFLTDPDNTLKRIPDLLRPLFRISLSRIRAGAQMHVCNMDKSHGLLLSFSSPGDGRLSDERCTRKGRRIPARVLSHFIIHSYLQFWGRESHRGYWTFPSDTSRTFQIPVRNRHAVWNHIFSDPGRNCNPPL